MESETFRTRVSNLMNRSRKALRLYSNVGKFRAEYQSEDSHELTELQTQEWRHITAELLKDISTALNRSGPLKQLVGDIYLLRDKYSSQWRSLESEIHGKRKELDGASEHGDFVKAASTARTLVLLKARMQAAQAAHHELQDVIVRGKAAPPAIELGDEDVVENVAPEMQAEQGVLAKVIPIRR